MRSQPVSRVLFAARRRATVIPLGPRSPAASSNLPGSGAGHAIAPLFGLAPDGVCRPRTLPPGECALTGSAPHRAARTSSDARHYFTLAASPLENCPPRGNLSRPRRTGPARGRWRYLSVALSVALRRPAVSRHPALRCPDFPLYVWTYSDCPADFAPALSQAGVPEDTVICDGPALLRARGARTCDRGSSSRGRPAPAGTCGSRGRRCEG